MNLDAEGERADKGIRRILWADGDDLVVAATDALDDLGFELKTWTQTCRKASRSAKTCD